MALSPMMQHYRETKEQNKDCILFYRLGDFYEMFFEDAILASKELEIALTGRDCGLKERAPMCGVPFHSANIYINKLISKGYKVAICEQLTDPKDSKGLVERGIVRIITPGTVVEEEMLEEKSNNYIASAFSRGSNFSMSLCDVSTGQFFVSKFSGRNGMSQLLSSLQKFEPNEIVLEKDSFLDKNLDISINKSYCNETNIEQQLKEQFMTAEIDRVELTKEEYLCAGLLVAYLRKTQKTKLEHINTLSELVEDHYMVIDNNARIHLELFSNMKDNKKHDSLLGLLDQTCTAMGGRMLKNWLSLPLLSVKQIEERLDAVQELKDQPILAGKLQEALRNVYDIERIISKLTYGSLNARDCVSLRKSLKILPGILQNLRECKCTLITDMVESFDTMEDVCKLLNEAIVDDPPLSVNEGDIINPFFNEEIGALNDLYLNSKEYLAALEQKEKEETGIKNLKLGYNKIFGYYLEVTKSYYDLVPYRYTRKQTLANCERFITQELKELENQIMDANTKRISLEYAIFQEIRSTLTKQIIRFQKTAKNLAKIDTLCSLACIASQYNYVRPEFTTDKMLSIQSGRHPIVERSSREEFVSNDTLLDSGENNFAIITGPNMAGKSTYMRQVALITIMAHIGSFVPAERAMIPITDQVFTRIGAADQLSEGKSTFMVEMSELASIVNGATKNSLIILDEIGRGTSTIDGLSIALATVMYITKNIGAKTLFATHYHQLSTLEGRIDGVVNYQIAVKEDGEEIVFLHKIKKGGTDKSFGIYVAKLAGLPHGLIQMADSVMEDLTLEEERIDHVDTNFQPTPEDPYKERYQILKNKLDNIDVNTLTPIEALNALHGLIEEE